MSESNTPRCDKDGYTWIYDKNGQPYQAELMPTDKARLIELESNMLLEALEVIQARYEWSNVAGRNIGTATDAISAAKKARES